MEIRTNTKYTKKLKALAKKAGCLVEITEDDSIMMPLIMIKEGDRLIEWTRGYTNVASFIKYGYVRIRKSCPYKIGKCKCEKCSLYIVRNFTGDCAHVWSTLK